MLSPVSWNEDSVHIIEQTRLPDEEVWVDLKTVEQVARAIRILDVRGAPAIGITAAFGLALAARRYEGNDPAELVKEVQQAAKTLAATRPTAVNLFWALSRMQKKLENVAGATIDSLSKRLIDEAQKIRSEDIAYCRAIGKHGGALLPNQGYVLTHCNAGALATGGYGTALGVIRGAVESGKQIHVFADETRPLLQGARLTTWELARDGIEVTLICDNMAGHLMKMGKIDACVVGSDRIAANGDVANKIGTYSVAVLAHRHDIPFYVAAPTSTIDLQLSSGDQIPIEEREASEVTSPRGTRFAPEGINVFNPAFDVTPNELVAAIITEQGVATHPELGAKLEKMVRQAKAELEN
ncbi:MAG: S-methyl-5-thioribose-1-phosphate isomerase [Deltaproteobacteria bacterium]|nr:S-methyl-5-thioribose-1-phosphate isomerase [Deltaproteobacteria bacterium]